MCYLKWKFVILSVLYDLGIFQVQLDVLSLKKLKNLLVFCFCLCFDVIFNRSSAFLQLSRLRCNILPMLFGRKIYNLICFCFRLRLGNKVLFFWKNVTVNLYHVSVVARAFE